MTDLPDGMVSAKDHLESVGEHYNMGLDSVSLAVIAARDTQWAAALAEANDALTKMNVTWVAREVALLEAELALDDARARIAELERDATFGTKAIVEVHEQALAASQAEVRALREALTYISEYWNGLENVMATSDAANMARDTSLAALSAPTSDAALREVCEKVANAARGPRPTRIASDCGEYYLTEEEWNTQIVSRVLGGIHAASE